MSLVSFSTGIVSSYFAVKPIHRFSQKWLLFLGCQQGRGRRVGKISFSVVGLGESGGGGGEWVVTLQRYLPGKQVPKEVS